MTLREECVGPVLLFTACLISFLDGNSIFKLLVEPVWGFHAMQTLSSQSAFKTALSCDNHNFLFYHLAAMGYMGKHNFMY